jgi:hypothetical protein
MERDRGDRKRVMDREIRQRRGREEQTEDRREETEGNVQRGDT